MSDDGKLTYDLPIRHLPEYPLKDVPGSRLAGLQLGRRVTRTVGGLRLGAEAGTEVEVRVFNSSDDEDPAAILGPPPDPGRAPDETGDALPPQIVFDPEHAWLRYGFTARVKGSAGTTLENAGISLEGKKTVTLLDYRRHGRDETVARAVARDALRPRLVSNLADLAALEPGDALAYGLRGELSLDLEVAFADLVAASLDDVAGWVHSDVPVVLTVDAGLVLSVEVSWVDDFVLAVTRASRDRLRLAVKKVSACAKGVSAELGLKVSFKDPKVLEEALLGVLERLIGVAPAEVDALFAAGGLDASPERRELFRRIAARLGFFDERLLGEEGIVESVYGAWAELEKKVEKDLAKLLRKTVEAGFAYDYRRIREDSSILQAVVPEEALAAWHRDLLRARIAPALEWLRSRPELVERYLHRSRIETSRTWGFSLGLGGAKRLSGRSHRKLGEVVREDLEGRRQVVYLGSRGHEDELGGDAVRWRVDFRAEMGEFSLRTPPHGPDARELDLGLVLTWRQENDRVRDPDLERLLDQARTWGLLDGDDLAAVREELGGAVREGRRRRGMVAELTLKLDHRAVLELARSTRLEERRAEALAAALPWWSDLEARREVRRRTRLYAPVWRSYLALDPLRRRNMPRSSLGELARAELRRLDGGKAAAVREGSALAERNSRSFAAQAANHPSLGEDWSAFQGRSTASPRSSTRGATFATRRKSIAVCFLISSGFGTRPSTFVPSEHWSSIASAPDASARPFGSRSKGKARAGSFSAPIGPDRKLLRPFGTQKTAIFSSEKIAVFSAEALS